MELLGIIKKFEFFLCIFSCVVYLIDFFVLDLVGAGIMGRLVKHCFMYIMYGIVDMDILLMFIVKCRSN